MVWRRSGAISILVLHHNDDVGVAKEVFGEIPAMHKVALREIAQGAPIRKFDQIIGYATREIGTGEHVHSHNCAYGEIDADPAPCSEARQIELVAESERPTFLGYR